MTPNADSGAVELMCSACGFRATAIVVAAHDCALDSDEDGLAALEAAQDDAS